MSKWSIHREVAARIPTRYGEFQLVLFKSSYDEKEHMALIMGRVEEAENVLVRVHSECFTGDVLGSLRCDCGEQLERAMEKIAERWSGRRPLSPSGGARHWAPGQASRLQSAG